MVELHISLAEDNSYNVLADRCHDICYDTGACFEWLYPEKLGWAIAQFSFRTDGQQEQATRMLVDLCSKASKPSHFILILKDATVWL